MAASEHSDSTASAGFDLLIGVAGPVDDETLRRRATQALTGIDDLGGSRLRVAVASPAANQTEAANVSNAFGLGLQFVHYPLASAAKPALPWLAAPAAYRELARLASANGARACVILGQDLAAMEALAIEALAKPLLDGTASVSMPIYPSGKYEALLNSGILHPFTRSLYGKHLRHPFAVDFGIAGGMIATLAASSGRQPVHPILSPAVDAAAAGVAIDESHLAVLHSAHSDQVDLSTVLGQLCGSLFEDAEKNAAVWQRVRGSQPIAVHGSPAAVEDGEDVDARPLIESFSLGFRNLQEVWGLVLPPITLMELKRLSRLPAGEFRMPDALWARIVYDFALAHRLRSISRTHLLGALTPLYLGWVASYTAEVRPLDAHGAEHRVERLAVAYEEAKPYFVSRWRWPDRFNP